jgi:transposase
MAAELAPPDVAARRTEWLERRQPRMRRKPGRLIVLDETAVNTKMTRLRGRARRGQRLRARAPFARWGTQTFIAGLRADRLVAPRMINGPINRAAFNVYVETQLAPTLARGDVVILDNFSVHNSAPAKAMLRKRGAWFLFLPQYSPDLNPIEMVLRQAQAHLRKAAARTFDDLIAKLGDICELYEPEECWNHLKAADMNQNNGTML